MRKIILYIATSLDGFIADKTGSLDWLEKFPHPKSEDYGFLNLINRIDTTLMGKNTFDFIANYDGPFPYPDTTNYVFSKSDLKTDLPIEVIEGDAVKFIGDLKKRKGKDIWLIGGGKLNSSFANAGIIDEIILTQIPVFLGDGIPVFDELEKPIAFSKQNSKTYTNGVLQLVGKVAKPKI